jgi:hypothetical protein
MIEQFINGPESPLKIREEIEKITESVCKAENTTGTVIAIQLKALTRGSSSNRTMRRSWRSLSSKSGTTRSLFQVNYLPSTLSSLNPSPSKNSWS